MLLLLLLIVVVVAAAAVAIAPAVAAAASEEPPSPDDQSRLRSAVVMVVKALLRFALARSNFRQRRAVNPEGVPPLGRQEWQPSAVGVGGGGVKWGGVG